MFTPIPTPSDLTVENASFTVAGKCIRSCMRGVNFANGSPWLEHGGKSAIGAKANGVAIPHRPPSNWPRARAPPAIAS